jgi:hypothetical protein
MGLLAVAAALGRQVAEIPTTNNYLESFNSFFKLSDLHPNRGIRLRADHLVALLITDIIPTILTRHQFQDFGAEQNLSQMPQALLPKTPYSFPPSPVRSVEEISQLIADFDTFGSSDAAAPYVDDNDDLVLDVLFENETDTDHEDFSSVDQSVDFDPLYQFCAKSTSPMSPSPVSHPMAAVDAARMFHDAGYIVDAVSTKYYDIRSQWESGLTAEIDAELGEAVKAFQQSALQLQECFNHVLELSKPCDNSTLILPRKRTLSDVDLIPLDKEKNKQNRNQSYSSVA